MSVFDDLAIVNRELRRMRPHDLKAAVREYRRGGLPASSMPEPVSGSRDYMPVRFSPSGGLLTQDPYDGVLDQAWKTYTQSIETAAKALLAARVAQSVVLEKAEPVPEPSICGNAACSNELEQGRESGQCGRCRKWKHDHAGLEYPFVVATDVTTEAATP